MIFQNRTNPFFAFELFRFYGFKDLSECLSLVLPNKYWSRYPPKKNTYSTVTSDKPTYNTYFYKPVDVDGKFDPSISAKITQEFFATPGIEVQGYSMKTVHKGKNSIETIINAKTLKYESTTVRTSMGKFTMNIEGSFTFGNELVAVGYDIENKLIMDITLPTSRNSSIGTTLYYNPDVFINNMNLILSTFEDALSKSRKLYPFPIMPLPILIFK